MTPYGRKNKYNAKKTMYAGKKYDSRKEAEYAKTLDGMLEEGTIKEWRRQERYPLPDINWFETHSKRSWYCADFVVTTHNGLEHVVEVKGILTAENKVKYAFWKYVYERPLHIVYTTGLAKMNTEWLECTTCPKAKKVKK